MKFTQVPSQYSNQFAEQTRLPNNLVAFCFIMVQRDGQKWSLMTSGGHTLIGIHLECWKQMTISKIMAIWQSIVIYKLYIHEEK
jgi:hypothetical protein